MLKKCLKHDLKYILNFWMFCTAVFLAVSVIGAISLRLYRQDAVDDRFIIICGMMIFYLGTFAYAFCGAGLAAYRCHQSCFTDEGYLTFTLPVKRNYILISKCLSVIIPFVTSLAVIAIVFHAVFAVVPTTQQYSYPDSSALEVFYIRLGLTFRTGYEACGFWMVTYVIEGTIIASLCITFTALSIFNLLANSLNSKRKPKRKYAKAIIAYLLIAPAIIALVLIILAFVEYSSAIKIAGTVTEAEGNATTFITLLMIICAAVIANAVTYSTCMKKISEKLNIT